MPFLTELEGSKSELSQSEIEVNLLVPFIMPRTHLFKKKLQNSWLIILTNLNQHLSQGLFFYFYLFIYLFIYFIAVHLGGHFYDHKEPDKL